MVVLVLSALLAASAAVLYVQAAQSRGAGYVRSSRSALYCAEAGLNATRSLIIESYATWAAVLDPAIDDPAWYAGGRIRGDVDGDGDNDDWEVTVTDNDDEFPVPDATHDNDLSVFITSRCLMELDQPRLIMELIRYRSKPQDYEGKCKGGQCANDRTGG